MIHLKYFWQDNRNVETKVTCRTDLQSNLCSYRNSEPQFQLTGSLPFHRGIIGDEVDKEGSF